MAWSYEDDVRREAEEVSGRIAFYSERVDLDVDRRRQERPDTPWSRQDRPALFRVAFLGTGARLETELTVPRTSARRSADPDLDRSASRPPPLCAYSLASSARAVAATSAASARLRMLNTTRSITPVKAKGGS